MLVGVTKNTKCSPVLSSRRLLAFSKGDNTKIASVGGSPRKGGGGRGGEGKGRDDGRWDRM